MPTTASGRYVIASSKGGRAQLHPAPASSAAKDSSVSWPRQYHYLEDAIIVSERIGGNLFKLVQQNGSIELEELKIDLSLAQLTPYAETYAILPQLLGGRTYLCGSEAEQEKRVGRLVKAGVTCAVHLGNRAELGQAQRQVRQIGANRLLHNLYLLVDEGPPPINRMAAIIGQVEALLDRSERVIIMSSAGSRAGLVLGCFLAHHGAGHRVGVLNSFAEFRVSSGCFIRTPVEAAQRQYVEQWALWQKALSLRRANQSDQ